MESLPAIIALCLFCAVGARAPWPKVALETQDQAPDVPAPDVPAPETNVCPSAGCSTQSCRKLVYETIRDFDETANPCDDFNQFACGNWKAAHREGSKAFTDAGLPVKELVLELLQQQQNDRILSLPGQFYGPCINAIEDQGGFEAWVKLIEDVFAEYDGWPLPCDKPVKTSLASVMAKATTLRGNGILDLVPEVRKVNGTKQLILKVKRYRARQLDRPYTQRNLPSYISEDIQEELDDIGRKLQNAFGLRRPQIRTFDVTTERLYGVEEFTAKFNLDIIGNLVTETASLYGLPELADLQLTVEESLEPYLSNLSRVLNTVTTRVQFNYVMYHLFFGLPWLVPPTEERCLNQVRAGIPLALNRLFAEKVFTKEYTDGFATLEKYIRGVYTEIFNKTTTGTPEDRKFLLEKLNGIKISNGYSRSLFDDELITSYFSGLGDLGDNYIRNAINVGLFRKGQLLQMRWAPEKLKGLQHDLASLGFLSVPTMNAHYVRSDNRIFMAPALLKAFYRKDGPMSHNFGQVGYVLGHEIGHAFDDDGIKTSKEGRLRDSGYISEAATEQYLSITSCIKDQFEAVANSRAFRIGQLIADNLGMYTAYEGYQKWLSDAPERAASDRLPVLQVSNEQMFFISAARTWCNMPEPDGRKYSFQTMRILMAAMNNEGFGEAFQCPSTAPMNPPECVYFR